MVGPLHYMCIGAHYWLTLFIPFFFKLFGRNTQPVFGAILVDTVLTAYIINSVGFG